MFLYQEGLVRFCTTPYRPPTSKNLACSFMHLTNYAVNKHNTTAFVAPTTAAAAAAGPAECQHEGGAGQTQQRQQRQGEKQRQQQQEQQQDRQQQDQEWQQEGRIDSETDGDQPAAAAAAACDASKWSFQQLRQHLEAQGERRGSHTHLCWDNYAC